MSDSEPSNAEIAGVLDRIADLLERQDANPHRARAYRNGAATVRASERPVAEILREGGRTALRELPNIGRGLAGVIHEFVTQGRSDVLARLEGEASPVDLFAGLPGVGEVLAQRVVDQLDLHTLEELEQAAHDGRLAQVEGFGPERIEGLRLTLAGLLSGAARQRIRREQREESDERNVEAQPERPDVGTLLDVDAEYRRRADAGELKRIAPKRFNPQNEAWLPIMHTEREGWSFTALYSNTARAHDLGTTHDWVVIYYEREDVPENQSTVVTETGGPLKGRRVVRGRAAENRRYYDEA